ncbi:MAG TPA: VWA domain-containing protein [Anaerolineae bacterium]|nr:VWA domain-containing protein [Anaerolineae bacterium]
MDRTRVVFVVIILGAMCLMGLGGVAYLLIPNGDDFVGDGREPTVGESVGSSSSDNSANSSNNPNVLVLDVASSSTKQNWLNEMVADFNGAGLTTATGKRIQVAVSHVSSGGSKDGILAGDIEPVAWSPGSTSWVTQLNEGWELRTNQPIASEACQDTIYTPLGVAMWRPMAEVLGWPDQPVSWEMLIDLAADPDGWGSYGRPEWGQFRFGHSHPQYSNAGMLTMTSLAYGITGKTSNLMPEELYAPEVEAALREIEQNTSKYGRITTDLLALMASEGPAYLHGVATFESDTVETNLTRANELAFPLAFIFPAEGTFWGSHPYCILDNAEWVSDEEVEAAEIFRDYMLADEQQALAAAHLLRPLEGEPPADGLLQLANGTDPRVTAETVPPLAEPDGALGEAVIDLFMRTKRKATIILVLDTSGSMQGQKMQTARTATAGFLERLDANDEVGVLLFNTRVTTLSPVQRVADVNEQLRDRVLGLVADGNTALYDATCQAVLMASEMQEEDLATGESRLYGVVVLSDGEDTAGTVSETQMFTTCLPRNAEADGIKVFPIAFGDEANEDVLARMARVTGGKWFKATPETIESVYFSISAEQ